MRLDRIYTRGGDRGETSLGDGTRVPKYHIRVRALGGIEEANAAIGVALLNIEDPDVRGILSLVLNTCSIWAHICASLNARKRRGRGCRADLLVCFGQAQT
jgi:cob(I)alamin adenosyltransferase